ncbi:MAG: winged helix-turn-helix domain-containing protein [Candidatus Omnitrophica bacterium]|nr:winged helix-turn-helix domain-containing protein [Candidatus Omnitrophota bacterium]
MLTNFFSSHSRIQVLKLFMLNPKNRYYPRQIEKLLKIPYTAVRRQLDNFEKAGLLKANTEANRKYYTVNSEFALFKELKSIILKTVGIGSKIKEKLVSEKEVELAFIYGSYAQNDENISSDIDIFIIGEINSRKLQNIVSVIQDETAREINQVVYSKKEFIERIKRKDHFINSVIREPKIFIKGMEDDLRKLVKHR